MADTCVSGAPPFSRVFLLALAASFIILHSTFFIGRVAAQDVTIGQPVTYTGLDETEGGQYSAPIKLKRSPKPEYPEKLRGTDSYGYAIAFSPTRHDGEIAKNSNISRGGSRTSILWATTYTDFDSKMQRFLNDWKWEPEFPTETDWRQAWAAIIFNPRKAAAFGKNTAPRLLDVVPVFPAKRGPLAWEDRVARADVTVSATGEIKSVKLTSTNKFATDREAAIVDAVSKWKIAPARVNGVPTEATINVPVLLLAERPGAERPAKAKGKNDKTASRLATKLTPRSQADTVYPKSLEKQLKSKHASTAGHVTLEFTLDDKGRPQNPVVVLSTNNEFDAPALDAIRKYRFAIPDPELPDTLGNICENPADARWQYDVNFRLPRPSVRGQNPLKPVLPPESVKTVAPVYPYHLLKDNITGSATAHWPYNTGWSHQRPDIVDATQEEFGLALDAAMRFYTIKTKTIMGKSTATMLKVTFDFNPGNPELRLSEKTKQLLVDETQNPEKIIPESKLDKQLKIRVPGPRAAMTAYINDVLKGTTIIEFLVDETGRVHLPRIIQTETPEAAYIVMQQISMRTYDPPMKDGRPVVARVRETVVHDATRSLKTQPPAK